jgi:hypothetical protein
MYITTEPNHTSSSSDNILLWPSDLKGLSICLILDEIVRWVWPNAEKLSYMQTIGLAFGLFHTPGLVF